jgi:hypothetical protein
VGRGPRRYRRGETERAAGESRSSRRRGAEHNATDCCDASIATSAIYDPSAGARLKTRGFVMTLGFSRRSFACLVHDQRVETWLHCHVAAFEHFGGVPATPVPDNLKAAVMPQTRRHDSSASSRLLDRLTCRGGSTLWCRPNMPLSPRDSREPVGRPSPSAPVHRPAPCGTPRERVEGRGSCRPSGQRHKESALPAFSLGRNWLAGLEAEHDPGQRRSTSTPRVLGLRSSHEQR